MTKKKLFLLDAFALIYRAHFAFIKNPRVTTKGVNTSAIFGFLNSLLDILYNENPSHIAVVFDTSEPTFRHIQNTAYKAHRESQPEDITFAIDKIKTILKAFNIAVLEKSGYEADDIIGTVATQLSSSELEIYMMTPDKDFAQLVQDNVYLYKPAYMGKKAHILDKSDILKKWEISHPHQVTDILGLWGDASDNIMGVPNVGEKTAKKLIKEYGSIENIIENIQNLKGKLKNNLEKHHQDALESKKLATIHTSIDIQYNFDDLKYKEPNEKKLRPLLQELEFKTIEKRIFKEIDNSNLINQTNIFSSKETNGPSLKIIKDLKYKLIDSLEKFTQIESRLKFLKSFSYIIETKTQRDGTVCLFSIVISFKKYEAFYIDFTKIQSNIKAKIKKIFQDKNIVKISLDLKKNFYLSKIFEIPIEGQLFDILIANYLLKPESRYSFFDIVKFYLDYIPLYKDYSDDSLENIIESRCEKVDLMFQLYSILKLKIENEELEKLYYEVEIPLAKVLSVIEKNGVFIDKEILKYLSNSYSKKLKLLEREIYQESGMEFNISSPKQLGEVLFSKLKISENPDRTKSGQYATGEAVLAKLSKKHDIVNRIIEYRELTKLKSTYVDALPNLISPLDGRIHTSYNQTKVATGRLSSTNPNLQNIPIRTEMGREIRKAFVPSCSDYKIMALDYSQIELRIVASFSEDKNMLDAFKNSYDIHSITASKIFSVEISNVSQDMRRKAKMVNFSIIYGISSFGLAQRLNISRKEASEIINSYFNEFKDIKRYMDNVIEQARKDGYVKTVLGRKRILNDINSKNNTLRKFSERNAINSPIQGTNAEMIKIAMVNIQNWIDDNALKSKMIMQVHDELIFEVHKSEITIMEKNVKKLMQDALDIGVPVEVSSKIGNSWYEI